MVLVNQAFVERRLAQREPTGSHIRIIDSSREVAGVVGDVQQQQSGWGDYGPLAAIPTVYVPAAQVSDGFLQLIHTWFAPRWVLRTEKGRSPGHVMASSWASQRVQSTLLAALAGLTLLMAGVGIYGLTAGSVAERTREVGIRLALGASVPKAIRTVALPGIWLSLAGIGLGSLLAWANVRSLRHLVWGVSVTDPLTFAVVAAP